MSYQTHICIQCVCVERGKKRLAAFSLAVKRKRTATVTGGAMKPWQHAKCWPTLRKWALCRSLGNQCKKRNTSPHTHENRLTNCWESAQPLATELWPAVTPWRHCSNSRSAGIKHSSQWELQKWKKKTLNVQRSVCGRTDSNALCIISVWKHSFSSSMRKDGKAAQRTSN